MCAGCLHVCLCVCLSVCMKSLALFVFVVTDFTIGVHQ